jgi:hypothetical protein
LRHPAIFMDTERIPVPALRRICPHVVSVGRPQVPATGLAVRPRQREAQRRRSRQA